MPRPLLALLASFATTHAFQLIPTTTSVHHSAAKLPARPLLRDVRMVAEQLPEEESNPPPPPMTIDPAQADLALATIGAGLAVYFLGEAGEYLGVQLYAPPIAASSIIIFSSISPVPPVNVFAGSMGAATFALLLYELFGASEVTRSVAVAGSLAWFKASGALFPPAAALAAVFLDSPALQEKGWTYLLFPCLSGNAILYVLAYALSYVRQKVRISITRTQLDFSSSTRKDFEEMFTKYDTSGDGRIDATELQVALRALVGADLDLNDCEKMVREADTDGDGSIDFNEFMALLQFDPKVTGASAAFSSNKSE